ncbi:TlpA family protein disulfide reductase [Natronorubrum thiooxidans]|uniref:Thiol-disulfide isomerase or thioredoxin n=1 Tax=Natronorubrum thiooxidans TaxID=308853 RepID=A0A1N7GKS9_9EURY|nr:TlpA disulfide reductase family protein [Natronorubrum thiooxidans]SIS13142.1 Thiol-disulfide isomerase or thioredoxin [Natronorubrum thiooxidans]
MRRRDALVGIGSLGVLGGSAVALRRLDRFFRDETVPETMLETIDARGSEAGETAIPARGAVTVLDFFATWCNDCKQYLDTLAEFQATVPETVQFVSVTTEQVGTTKSRDDIAAWWNWHGGNWTVALDPSLAVAEPIGATYVPHTFVLDESNAITWSESGLHTVSELDAALETAGVVPR